MINNKLKWYIIDKEYVNYLRKFDEKVENIDYNFKLKPYIGTLININDINFYVPISSPKKKHESMKDGIDFIKIKQKDKTIGVLNLNNMIPILDKNVEKLRYSEIEQYRNFNSDKEKKLYIALLNFELTLINNKREKIKRNAMKIYNEKIVNPNSEIAKRCCNFKLLEDKCKEYNKEQSGPT